MKHVAIALALLAAAPLAASADISKEDIKKLAAAGVGDEVILSFIRSNGPVSKFTADDLVEMKQAGASEKVLSALAAGTPGRPQVMVEKQVVERNYEPQTYAPSTVVYQQPYYASTYAYPYSGYYGFSGYYGYPYYYSSCYPRYGYGYGYCAPRVSVGVGFSSWGHCAPRATWSLSFRR